ncbi:hypothetical protein [Aequorivita sp. KMM 9714]|uniref:hypothetical protein n=1 Tax=Aequorivita sp. KMM 9714 TaxID=2707173 RepID=UPI0013EB6FFC|nr:hypothetical protein [Aequorivita sp. KMM 9714]NGX85299.1 hypothetical protein [Aequorivita sp. KMM 9714]
MNKAFLLIIIITFFSCQTENSILGSWELNSDSEIIKSQIEIYASGKEIYAKRTKLSEINKEYGWAKNDICWKDIKKLNDSTYSCIRIAKRLNNGVTEVLEVESIIEVRSEDLFTIKAFYTDNKLNDEGKIQPYIRLK